MRGRGKPLLVAAAVAASGLAPSAQAEGNASLAIYGDMVRGVGPEGLTGPPCVLTSQYKHKEKVVWRIRVTDPATGKALDAKGIKSLEIALPDGQTFAARYSGHPPPKPIEGFWTATWTIPEAYPTGSFSYKVIATALDGRATEWEPFKTSPLTVIAGNAEFAPAKR